MHASTSHHKIALSHVVLAWETGSSLSEADFIICICLLSFIPTVLHCCYRTILETQREPPQKLGLIQDKAAYSIAGQRIINLKGQITCVLHTLRELPKARWPEDTDAHLSSRKVNQGHSL